MIASTTPVFKAKHVLPPVHCLPLEMYAVCSQCILIKASKVIEINRY